MEQTGWHVTIMAGGPSPNSEGMVMTYLLVKLSIAQSFLKLTEEPIDHTQGRRKTRKNLTNISASRSMMTGYWILRGFFMRHSVSTFVVTSYQKELTPFVAQEDCTARSLVKGETQDESENLNVGLKESSEEAVVEKDDEESDEESDDDNVNENINSSMAKSANKGVSDYYQRREKNIAELKKILGEVKAKHPMPELTKGKGRAKKRCVITMHQPDCVTTHSDHQPKSCLTC